MDPVALMLIRIFTCTSLAGSLAWIADYSRDRWWHNSVGKNLVTKTAIISSLLLIGLLFDFFPLGTAMREVLLWIYAVLLGLIGPVMVWRMRVFRRLAGAVTECPAGHSVSSEASYCSQCGLRVVPGPPADS